MAYLSSGPPRKGRDLIAGRPALKISAPAAATHRNPVSAGSLRRGSGGVARQPSTGAGWRSLGASRNFGRGPATAARNRPPAGIDIPRRRGRFRQEPRPRFLRPVLLARFAVEQETEGIGRSISGRQHQRNPSSARHRRPLYQHAVSLRRTTLPETRSGAGTGTILRAPRVSAAIRSLALIVEGNRPPGGEP